MNIFQRTVKRISEYIHNSSIDLKERCFVVFNITTGAAFLESVILRLILGISIHSVMVPLISALLLLTSTIFAFQSGHIKGARVLISVFLIAVSIPSMFFVSGGVYGSSSLWILLGIYYLVFTLEGKFRIILGAFLVLETAACWTIQFYRPEILIAYGEGDLFGDTVASVYIVGSALVVFISFQSILFKREKKLSDEKTREAEELNRTQSRFFSSMSHEIRTPINTVLGLNEIILRQEDASEEIRRDARNIQGAGKMLLALINDILDVSKIEAGKMEIVPVNYSVSALLSEIVNMIWLKAEEKGLHFHVDIDPNVPETLFGDEVRIKQILINLLNNAVKYTKEGSVSLHIECDFPETGEALLKINVSDTGMGIKAESLPHLFDSFQRIDEEKNRHIEGTGLGLSIVKQLVELMEGTISVNSVYSQGSTFAVSLKQGISSDKRVGDMNITNMGTGEDNRRFEHSFHAPEGRILIVDDNEMNLQVERKLLEGTEMTVDLALSGSEALGKTLQNRYDVIFMDHLMPEMDGIQCFSEIRTQKGGLNQRVPIIVLTANAGGENMELYRNTGFDGYLVKPVSGSQLEDMLLRHLPPEKIIGRGGEGLSGSSINTASGYAKKRPVAVATSSMSDLPPEVLKELQVNIIPYTVTTDEGVFYDNLDIDSEELVRYMEDRDKYVTSEPPTEEDMIRFFSSELQRAHHLIYITLTTGSSREYGRAIRAAKSFGNVSVINSECMSSATGILVMIAGRLAQQNMNADRIVSELEEVKKQIRCSFVIRSTDVMARRDRISPFMHSLLDTLWLRPVLRMKNDKLGVGKFLLGSEIRCYEKYIHYALSAKGKPDTSFVFVTYAGMEEEELLWIEEKLKERIKFEHVIFQKASAGITSNCGGGTFGILYLTKGEHNYNLGTLFASNEDVYAEPEEDDIETEMTDGSAGISTGETAGYNGTEWYESIPGIDPEAGIKNSGSKETFLSVLKIYYDSFDDKYGEIRDYYESGDWENYTIKVHALKSSSRLVGAMSLGREAEALEMAGKNSDLDFIGSHHENMMRSYQEIHDALTDQFGVSGDLPEIPPDMLEDAYAGLAEFADAMDYELAKMVTDSMKEYTLPEEDGERFSKIRTLLSGMDWDGIKKILEEREV